MSTLINQLVQQTSIAAWNACGVAGKREELRIFIEEQHLDILLISETWLRPANKLTIPNYHTYRSDRLTGRNGGVAILIKKDLNHTPIYLSGLHFLEAVGVQISVRSLGPLRVFVYAPPGRGSDWRDLDLLFDGDIPALAAGDFNAKHGSWGCRSTNGYGSGLFNYLSPIPISVHPPDNPTFYRPGVRPDILDIALAKNIPAVLDVQVLAELSSDHDPILIVFGAGAETAGGPLARRTNWKAFERIMADRNFESHENIQDAAALESAACGLTNIITTSLDKASSWGAAVPDRWLPLSIRQLLRDKRRAKKRAQQTGCPADTRIPMTPTRR